MPKVLRDLSPGCRVVVRYRHNRPDDGPPLSDAVGELIEVGATHLRLTTRRGEVAIALEDVVTARQVEASRAAILRLEDVAALGWQAREVVRHQGWLLRADAGWTGRANSAIQLESSQHPLDEHLQFIEGFYRDRNLRPMISCPLPARQILDDELGRRGWTERVTAVVMTERLAGRPPEGADVELLAEPTDVWLALYHYRDQPLPPAARSVLARHERVRFAQLTSGGEVVAVARGVVDEHWLGISAVEVHDAHRRRGHARQLLHALEAWGMTEGATHAYLQVEQDNAAAIALYARAGFSEHHRYRYRVAP